MGGVALCYEGSTAEVLEADRDGYDSNGSGKSRKDVLRNVTGIAVEQVKHDETYRRSGIDSIVPDSKGRAVLITG